MKLLVDRILGNAETHAPRVAMISANRAITYRQLLALVVSAARMFHAMGVRAGDIAGVAMGQGPLHLVAFLALARIGAVALPQFPGVPPAHRARSLERYGARWIVSDEERPERGTATLIAMRELRARGDERGFEFTSFAPSDEAPLRIAVTSGTMGAQKAFLHTHGQLTTRVARRFAGDRAPARAIPPLLHITSALQVALHALDTGGAVVFPATDEAASFLAAIHLHAVTHVSLPPADLARMLQLLTEDVPAFPSLQQVRLVGAAPSAGLLQLAKRRFSPNLSVSYSVSEAGMIAVASAELLDEHGGAAAMIVPGARVEALSPDGAILPAGERGALRVSVEAMPRGYYGPDASLPGYKDGWFHPGDEGYVTQEGLVFVTGRSDTILNTGGHKAAPEYIEAKLAQIAGVRDAAVLRLDDAIAGGRIAAILVTDTAADWPGLVASARASLGDLAPERYFRADALPRNAMGKLERSSLAGWIGRSEPVTVE